MIGLILPCGNNFGWGICGKYLTKELSALSAVTLITEDFDLDDIGDELDFHMLRELHRPARSDRQKNPIAEIAGKYPVLKAITDQNLQPWLTNARGAFTVGYTFFEMNVLSEDQIRSGRSNFDVVVTGSKWCEAVLRNNGMTEVTTIIQGIDPQLFNSAHAAKALFKDRFVVFSGGKFELRKGQDLVIRAYKVLQDRHSDVLLVTAWHNPWTFSMKTMETSPYINCRIAETDAPGSINRILYENGIDLKRVINVAPRPNAQMARLYKNTDVGLFPNRCEGGTNLVLMEYMACGKPVIAAFNSGHKDVLTPSNSIMIKQMKPMKITSQGTVQALWDDPDLDETVAHLEASYQNKSALDLIGKKAGDDLAGLTWRKTAAAFYRLLADQRG